MRLSVIVPVYNMEAGEKLKWCLDSLAAQTLPEGEMEVIMVDDCSTDGSFALMKEYEKAYPEQFLAVHSPVNHHQGGAKNIGLSLAKGDWIGFIDADDWITGDYYARLLGKAEETGADMVGCDYCFVSEHTFKPGKRVANNRSDQTGVLDEEKYRKLILDTGSLVVKIYRRGIIYGDRPEADANRLQDRTRAVDAGGTFRGKPVDVFPEDIFYEDNAVCNTWVLRAKHFEYIPEALYYYYQHSASTVHTISEKNLKDRCTAGRMIVSEAKRHGYFEKYQPEIEFLYTVLFYVNTLFSAMPKEQHIRHCYAFTKNLGQEMKETFPDFQKNPYYQERIHAEEKKLIAMQMKSQLLFYCYYRVLWAYRNFRRK